ncbi:MAG: hypothetical protein ACLGIF_08460 [Actinomycetes bacterium]
MPAPFHILLRNHQAGGQAAVNLFRRAARAQRGRPYATQLRQLATEAREDLDFNESVMRRLGVRPSPVQVLALRAGGRIGRLKPNGQLLRRAPLSDLIELEGLIASVSIKLAGWQAAQVSGVLNEEETRQLDQLMVRARSQADRLSDLHQQAAATVLTDR